MKKHLFVLVTICLLAFGLVSLALEAASAAGAEKPTGAALLAPDTHSAYHQVSVNNSAPGSSQPGPAMPDMDQRSGAEEVKYSLSPVDQMRREVMSSSNFPEAVDRVEFWLNQSSMSYMWGHADPDVTITVTTPREQYNVIADVNGDWGTDAHELYPGEQVTVDDSLGFSVTITIPIPLEAHADSSLGEVWGQIGGWYTQDVEIHRNWGGDPLLVQTDGAGAFVASDSTMPHGAVGYIRFADSVDTTTVIYHRPFYDIVPGLRVNYAHDWVEADYEPDYTVWLTLTDSTGAIKATASGETGMIPWWGGATGFQTGYNLFWSPSQTPDIQEGDWVYVSLEDDHSNQVRIGSISGALDLNADTVSGTIYAPWFTQTLGGGCGVWVQNGPGTGFDVDPNGGSYFCDFAAMGWDLIAGHDVGVNYWEPDGNQVINVFREPAPHLWINTWGQGDAAAGGNYILSVEYNNDGDAVAEGVSITATLLNGMAYLGDTSGVTPTGDGQPGNPLVWYLGDLPVSHFSSHGFEIFVQITAALFETIDHEVSIETTTPYFQGDPESKYSYWSGSVAENNTDVNVGKGVWTWDPSPGNDFVYSVNVCGSGTTASTELTLTDTLPLSTTLVSWWAQRPGWEEVTSSPNQLVVRRPSVPSGWCGEVYLRVHLDAGAWQGMQLDNFAEIFAANDLDPNNNSAGLSHNVGAPHTNLSIWKDWNWGNFVPGGDIYYEFRYQNTGNLPAENVRVTSTLPAGTTFSFAYISGDRGWIPITPTLVTSDHLVWEVGLLDNGYGQSLGVALQIDPATEPGSLLTHTVEISPQPVEDRYDDNASGWIERVNDPGPNLSVDKHTNWRWNWEGQLEFELRIRNLGTEPLDDFWMTDTYPASTGFYGNFWQNHGPWITYTHDAPNRQITLWMDYLNPGETASIGYQLDLDPGVIGQQGLAFTNLVEAPITNDTNPLDNVDTVIAHTGPDVFIEKEISAGELRAGELVTFTVTFGNKNPWPWGGDEYGSHIIDTLPAEMTFVRATAPWNPAQSWDPIILPGNHLLWEWGTMWNDSRWYYDIVVQITDTVAGGDVLTNHIEAFGDSPNNIDPDGENNVYDLVMTIEAAPQASFVTNSPVDFGEPMSFTNTSVPGYPSPVYDWDFGDGDTSTAENPTHLYAAFGTYTVTLTVSNDVGISAFSQTVEMAPPMLYLPLILNSN